MTPVSDSTERSGPSRAAMRALEQAIKARPPRDDREGPPRSKINNTSSDREITSTHTAVHNLLATQGWEHLSVRATLQAEWRTLVGADLADHVQPVDLTDGVLALRADSTAWATQVRMLANELQMNLDRRFGADVITRIEVQGPTAPRWGSGPRRVPGRGPRDTYG